MRRAAALAIAALALTPAAAGAQNSDIPVCHATGNPAQPYILINVPLGQLPAYLDNPDDIVPAPPEGCPGAEQSSPTPVPTASSTPTATATASPTASPTPAPTITRPAADRVPNPHRRVRHSGGATSGRSGGSTAPRASASPTVSATASASATHSSSAAGADTPVVTVRHTGTRLPRTGTPAPLLALFGLGFLLTGLGGRILLTDRRP